MGNSRGERIAQLVSEEADIHSKNAQAFKEYYLVLNDQQLFFLEERLIPIYEETAQRKQRLSEIHSELESLGILKKS